MTATVGMAMLSAAHLTASDGDVPSGIRLAARAVRIHEEYDFEPAADDRGPTTEDLFDQGRAKLGIDAFEQEREAGRRLSLPDAITIADGVLTSLAAGGPSRHVGPKD